MVEVMNPQRLGLILLVGVIFCHAAAPLGDFTWTTPICAIQFSPIQFNVTNTQGIMFNSTYFRLATDDTCETKYPGTGDMIYRWGGNTTGTVYIFSPSLTGTGYACYTNDSYASWYLVNGAVTVNTAPTWRMTAPTHAIAGQPFSISVGYFDDNGYPRWYNDTGGAFSCPNSGNKYTVKLAYDPSCALDFPSSTSPTNATSDGTLCTLDIANVTYSSLQNIYVCMNLCGVASYTVVRPGPLVIHPPPLYMAPDLMASRSVEISFARVRPRGNETGWQVKGVLDPDNCASAEVFPAVGWNPGYTAVITPSLSRKWGDYGMCLQVRGSSTWMPIYPKVRNTALVRCQTHLADQFCWCLPNDDTGSVTADCRSYYFEPWVDYSFPMTPDDFQSTRAAWDQNSFDSWTEFYIPIVPNQPSEYASAAQ